MASFQSKIVRFLIKVWQPFIKPISASNLHAKRSSFTRFEKFFAAPKHVIVKEIKTSAFKGEWLKSPKFSQEKVVLFLHGGGFVLNGTKLYRKLAASIASKSG